MTTKIEGMYFGEAGPLFKLYIKTALLTLVTLGIYRFWAKTRLRKYVWSGVSGDGDGFEYTGTGLEKLLGFLIAIVILAVYLGLVQMALFFFGVNMFTEPTTYAQALGQIAAIYITFFAVLPLLLFAQYRARRYKMARSRWRGIRFGMENGAWGYVLRALGYYFLAIVSFGLLTPLATFKLEKYMADRSWYGDAKFVQNGKWTALYGGFKWLLIGMVLLAAGIGVGVATQGGGLAALLLVVGYAVFLIGAVYYRVFALNYMAGNKVLDGEVTFGATASTGEVVRIALLGGIGIVVIFAVVGLVAASVMGAVFATMAQTGQPPIGAAIIGGILYVSMLLALGGLSLVWITQPIIGHVVQNITVQNAGHLDTIRQRAADAGADAEGFADALDVGGAL